MPLHRDEDVLDTWFSSALWPFSTLGWPDDTPELRNYYPTDVLVTGFDIIFFWVARMMMMGLEFMDEEPFHTVYMHALVRDEQGQKMSKTKGNVIDPLELDRRLWRRRHPLHPRRHGRAGPRSAARHEPRRGLSQLRHQALERRALPRDERVPPRRRLSIPGRQPCSPSTAGSSARPRRAVAQVTKGIEDFKFNEAANAAYDFVWGTFCDWYVELAKPVLTGEDEAAKAETQATAACALDQILKLLHPFMPFVTEELWAETGKVGPARARLLILSRWPIQRCAAKTPKPTPNSAG